MNQAELFDATDIIDLSLRDVYRATDLHRWQIVKTARQQTLAEHSFQVAMIAARLCDLVGPAGLPSDIRNDAVWLALRHDLPEVLTGDIATPVKRLIGEKGRSALNQFEGRVRVFGHQPDVPDSHRSSATLKAIVKMADLAEAVTFLHENGVGDHAHMVRARITENLFELARSSPLGDVTRAVLTVIGELTESEPQTMDGWMDGQ